MYVCMYVLLCCRHQIIRQVEQYMAPERQQVYHSLQHCRLVWTLIRWKPDAISAVLSKHISNFSPMKWYQKGLFKLNI